MVKLSLLQSHCPSPGGGCGPRELRLGAGDSTPAPAEAISCHHQDLSDSNQLSQPGAPALASGERSGTLLSQEPSPDHRSSVNRPEFSLPRAQGDDARLLRSSGARQLMLDRGPGGGGQGREDNRRGSLVLSASPSAQRLGPPQPQAPLGLRFPPSCSLASGLSSSSSLRVTVCLPGTLCPPSWHLHTCTLLIAANSGPRVLPLQKKW